MSVKEVLWVREKGEKMKLKRIIYIKKDKDFKKNGCVHLWSADYPDIKEKLYIFSDDMPCAMAISGKARRIMEKVRIRNGEPPFCLVDKDLRKEKIKWI